MDQFVLFCTWSEKEQAEGYRPKAEGRNRKGTIVFLFSHLSFIRSPLSIYPCSPFGLQPEAYSLEPVFLHLIPQRAFANIEHPSGFGFIVAGFSQGFGNEFFFQLLDGLRE